MTARRAEGSFEAVILGEAEENDLERALQRAWSDSTT